MIRIDKSSVSLNRSESAAYWQYQALLSTGMVPEEAEARVRLGSPQLSESFYEWLVS